MRIVKWIKRNRRTVIIVAAAVVAVVALVYYVTLAQQRREAYAERQLSNARTVAAAGNPALAAADLAQLVSTHTGTAAAQEAALLLAQIRLMDGQPDAAVAELQALIERGPSEEFVAPANGLLGSALEQAGSRAEAVTAYRRAASAAWYDFLKAQYLVDAARVLAALGDTAQAAAVYEEVLSDLPETDTAVEAQLRLAELRASGPDSAR